MLSEEVAFLKGVKEQFQRLQNELRGIKSFLKDADAKQHESAVIRTWVEDVKDVTYDIEDIIDTFILKVAPNKEETGIYNGLMRYATAPKKARNLHKMGNKIQLIFARIEEISNRRERYNITSLVGNGGGTSSSTTNNQNRLRRTYAHDTDDDIVGLKEETSTLLAELLKVDDILRVHSIVGMGGLGKTTLAKQIYNHKDVKHNFDCLAWTFISQQFHMEDVLQEILRKISSLTSGDMKDMKAEELVEKLFFILQSKRYLVILDDIWSKEVWDILKPAFPNGKKGCKVILTTRSAEIAMYADPWSRHIESRSLTKEESWKLLCKKALPKNGLGTSSPLLRNLEKCGREMVNKCCGLPLAVVALGGVLATKKSLNEWETVSKDINVHISKSKGHAGVLAILALSYSDLPYHLKPLFLYLGLFPEDFHISIKKVILMWIAENLVVREQDVGGMEENGKYYFNELLQRCVIEISSRSLNGKPKTFQLHDMMRDLCISKAREENFFEIIQRNSSLTDSSTSLFQVPNSRKIRKCAIYLGNDSRYALPEQAHLSLRTVFFFKSRGFSLDARLNLDHPSFKLVRVLEIEIPRLLAHPIGDELGRVLAKLVKLRYLSLKNTSLMDISKSMDKLFNLEVLDLRGTYLNKSPSTNFANMRQLRHLYLGGFWHNSAYLRIGTTSKLQTLCSVSYGPWVQRDLIHLTHLRKLGIHDIPTDYGMGVMRDIMNYCHRSKNLQSLSLQLRSSSNERKFFRKVQSCPDLEPLSHNHQLLKLMLSGKIKKSHSYWPPNLVKLNLKFSEFEEDPMPILGNLQHLVYLQLYDPFCYALQDDPFGYTLKEIVCSANAFPLLKYLHLIDATKLEEWRVEEGTMPSLTKLLIGNCPGLKMIPTGLRFVTTLQRLEIINMPRKYEERTKEGGEDWCSVQHIPSIKVEHDEMQWYWYNR
ncbi:hypothetical protein AQUCO_07800031v1 [Aquilegia coerulea]|uniref:AAA+ ATPase domain-containing protein n=1 Tax=Aquilegia coerulea TaxID=218851 RepID=A0A2G5C824_AQUCA|nr:hypothetical protein AQUCO_07800031v1 [Aquilegia coerulea]